MDPKNAKYHPEPVEGFIGAIALYQNRRDNALGLAHVTTQQKGLLWYYNYLQYEAYRDLMAKSFHLGVIRGARKSMRRIKRKIKTATSVEQAQSLYREYMILQELFNKSIEVLNPPREDTEAYG